MPSLNRLSSACSPFRRASRQETDVDNPPNIISRADLSCRRPATRIAPLKTVTKLRFQPTSNTRDRRAQLRY